MSPLDQHRVQTVTTLGTPPRSKSLLLSALLTFFLGPLGMIYTTIVGFLVMSVLTTIVGILTLGHGLAVMWPLCMIWGVWAGHRFNERERLLAAARAW